jgi:hypothetical protein
MDVSRSRRVQSYRLFSLTRSLLVGIVLVSVLFQPISAIACELNHAEITEDKGIFRFQFTTIIDAPAEYVRQVLTDFTHIYRLSSSIIESEVLPSRQSDETKIRTKVLACASVFCREVERVDIVRILASGKLQADIVPELSEFRSGRAIWTITALENRSKLVYEATLEPDFFVPPVIGISVIINSMRNEFITTLDRIERIAYINAKRDGADDLAIAHLNVSETTPPCE